jgi:hypothetical protein
VSEIVDGRHWQNPKYDHEKYRGLLPHEPSQDEFSERWNAVQKRVRGGPQFSGQRVRVHWPSLSFEFLADDVIGMQRSDLYHCHEFVRAITYLLELRNLPEVAAASPGSADTVARDQRKKREKDEEIDVIDQANKILRHARGERNLVREIIADEFDAEKLAAKDGIESVSSWYTTRQKISKDEIEQVIERAIAAVDYISDDVQRYYFGKAKEYASQRIILTRVGHAKTRRDEYRRLEVIDLPSFPDSKTRFLALNSVLSTIWDRARAEWSQAVEAKVTNGEGEKDTRVPTFIVVDEAHNLIPKGADRLAAQALREQFRSIAAEGRKYGLFLILCTQRPDKIDELVLSECENRAIMRLGSQSVLDITTTLLGLEEVQESVLKKCLEFETGRALLIGRWAKSGHELLYTAMRRTEEGGRSLDDGHWASAPSKSPDKSEKPATAGNGKSTPAENQASKPTIPAKPAAATTNPATTLPQTPV